MSWLIHYRLELKHSLTAAERKQVSAHTERWSDQLSAHCSGYELNGRVGDRELQGTLQPSGDHRTTHDVLTVVRALQELEQQLRGRAFISRLHVEDDEYEVGRLDLKDLEDELTCAWGDMDLGLEDDDRPEPTVRPPPDPEAPDDVDVEATLRAAREAFAQWQQQKKSRPS